MRLGSEEVRRLRGWDIKKLRGWGSSTAQGGDEDGKGAELCTLGSVDF
jgi:hypothetical protein